VLAAGCSCASLAPVIASTRLPAPSLLNVRCKYVLTLLRVRPSSSGDLRVRVAGGDPAQQRGPVEEGDDVGSLVDELIERFDVGQLLIDATLGRSHGITVTQTTRG
jgi:hypothetical protein